MQPYLFVICDQNNPRNLTKFGEYVDNEQQNSVMNFGSDSEYILDVADATAWLAVELGHGERPRLYWYNGRY